jgi:catechol 2,3-dioxygenase-like lactoylglutathione lyase family enzyme
MSRYGKRPVPPSAIRFDSVNLIVSDMAASRAFYATLGLDFGNAHEPIWDEHHLVAATAGGDVPQPGFDLDSASFATKWNSGWAGGPGVVLGFRVDSRQAVDDVVAELVAGGAVVQQPPYDAFWGSRYAIVSDPDGHAVGIMSPGDDAHRSASPSPA